MRFLGSRKVGIAAALWIALAATASAPAAASSPATIPLITGPSPAGYVDPFDCARAGFLRLSPGDYVVTVTYEMAVTAEGRKKVGTALCRALVGTWLYRYKRGNDAAWVRRGLKATVEGTVDGDPYQAAWSRDENRMRIAVNLADRASPEELVFTFGHELGHAVLRHPPAPKDTSARTATGGAAAGGTAGYQVGKHFGTEGKVGGTLLGLLAGGVAADIYAHKSRCNQTPQLQEYEIAADEFSVRVLYYQGYTLDQAKLAAMSLLSTNWQDADCTSDHPATSKRLRLIEKLEPLPGAD